MTSEDQKTRPAREVVGVFGDSDALEAAAAELLGAGFDRDRISLLASENAIAEKLGHKYERVEELEDDLDIPRTVYRSKETFDTAKTALLGGLVSIGAVAAAGAIFASGGPLVVTLGSGLIGAEIGGFLGGVLGELVENHHADYLREQLGHGGLLLWVRTADDAEETSAKRILSRHSGRDVHAHALAAAAEVAISRP
ncbi:MAG: hypothetical protein WB816_00225 [Methylocystis sp.]